MIYTPQNFAGVSTALIPASYNNLRNLGYAISVSKSEHTKSKITDIVTTADSFGYSASEIIETDSHYLCSISTPRLINGAPEIGFEFLQKIGFWANRLNDINEQTDEKNSGVIEKRFERFARNSRLGDDLNPSLLGMNSLGVDVYQSKFGRFFSHKDKSHFDFERGSDGLRKDSNTQETARAGLFLSVRDKRDWNLIARAAVATAMKFGEVSNDEIDDWIKIGNQSARDNMKLGYSAFRELIEQEIMFVVKNGYVRGRENAKKITLALPNYSERSATKQVEAQFSTPLPLGRIASEFMAGRGASRLLEPSIGNGLLIADSVYEGMKIEGYELETSRAERAEYLLSDKDGHKIHRGDFLKAHVNAEFDGVIANPPFGRMDEDVAIAYGAEAPLITRRLHDAIALKSMTAIRTGGSAVVVMPADMMKPERLDSLRSFVAISSAMFENVKCVGLDSHLYKSMGANAAVLTFFMEDKRAEPLGFEEAGEHMRQIGLTNNDYEFNDVVICKSFDDFYEHCDQIGITSPSRNPIVNNELGKTSEDKRADQTPTGQPESAVKPQRSGKGQAKGTPAQRENRPSGGVKAAEEPLEDAGDTDIIEELDDVPTIEWYEDNLNPDPFTIEYVSRSKVGQASTVIQKSLQYPTSRALQKLADNVGDIDQYVADNLGISVEKLQEGNVLSPEQIDSVALGMNATDSGKSMIVGDKMGVGKGRQLAAHALRAFKNNRPVMFGTISSTLFSDMMVRDLRDVSERSLADWLKPVGDNPPDIRPFIFNRDKEAALMDKNELVFKTDAVDIDKAKKNHVLPKGTNLVMLTYSQLQDARHSLWRFEAIMNWLEENKGNKPLLLLDEIHKAAGVDSYTGLSMQRIIQKAQEVGGSIIYSSATSMKSGRNIAVYSAALPDTGLSIDELMNVMESNPLSLQEILALEMAGDGRLIEREMSTAGVERVFVNYADLNHEKLQIARELVDATSRFLSEMMDMSEPVKEAAKEMAKRMAASVSQGSADKANVTVTSPASQFDRYSRYLMASVKAMFIEEHLAMSMERGEKPVFVVEATGDTLLEWMVSENADSDDLEISNNVRLNKMPDMGDVLIRNARRLLEIKVATPDGQSKSIRIKGFDGWLEDFEDRIRQIDFSMLSLNVGDRIEKAGQDFGVEIKDITGRKYEISRETNEDGNTQYLISKREAPIKAESAFEFAEGVYDGLVINKGASTGMSLHASKAIGHDNRRRAMHKIEYQRDITDERQVEGRVHRTRQVSSPIYYIPRTGFAADERQANLFNRANRNLSASTSGTRENRQNIEGADLLSPVGDMAVQSFLRSNPYYAERLGIDPKETRYGFGQKFLGRSVVFEQAEQQSCFAEVDMTFSVVAERLSMDGENPLVTSHFDYEAKVETIATIIDGDENAESISQRPVVLNELSYIEHKYWTSSDKIEKRIKDLKGEDSLKKYDFEGMFVSGEPNYEHPLMKEALGEVKGVGVVVGGRPTSVEFTKALWDQFRKRRRQAPGEDKNELVDGVARSVDITLERLADDPNGTNRERSELVLGVEATNALFEIIQHDKENPNKKYPLRSTINRIVTHTLRAEKAHNVSQFLARGSVVGIASDALKVAEQGEWGTAFRKSGQINAYVPATIITTGIRDGNPLALSNWDVSISVAGTENIIKQPLSMFYNTLDYNVAENGSPEKSLFCSTRDLYREISVRYHGLQTEDSENVGQIVMKDNYEKFTTAIDTTDIGRDEGILSIEDKRGKEIYQILNDLIPSGAIRQKAYAIEGNLFVGMAMAGGEKSLGFKCTYTDENGNYRHAIMAKSATVEGLKNALMAKSRVRPSYIPDMDQPENFSTYMLLVRDIFYGDGDFNNTTPLLDKIQKPEHRERIKEFIAHNPSWDYDRFRGQVISGIRDHFQDERKTNVPMAITLGGKNPYGWAMSSVGSKLNKVREKSRGDVQLENAGNALIDCCSLQLGGYSHSFTMNNRGIEAAIFRFDQDDVSLVFKNEYTAYLLWKKTNGTIKTLAQTNQYVGEIMQASSNKAGDLTLKGGVLAYPVDLLNDHSVKVASHAMAAINQENISNAVALSGFLKDINKIVDVTAEKIIGQHIGQEKAQSILNDEDYVEPQSTMESPSV